MKLWAWIGIGVVAVILLLAYVIGFFSLLNQPINQLVNGKPDTSCNADEECVYKSTRCSSCNCGGGLPVNVNTPSAFCPFWEGGFRKLCDCYDYLEPPVCVDRTCKRPETKEELIRSCERVDQTTRTINSEKDRCYSIAKNQFMARGEYDIAREFCGRIDPTYRPTWLKNQTLQEDCLENVDEYEAYVAQREANRENEEYPAPTPIEG